MCILCLENRERSKRKKNKKYISEGQKTWNKDFLALFHMILSLLNRHDFCCLALAT